MSQTSSTEIPKINQTSKEFDLHCYQTLIDYKKNGTSSRELEKVVKFLLKMVTSSIRDMAHSIYKGDVDLGDDKIMEGFYLTIFEKIVKYEVKGSFVAWVKRCTYLYVLEQTRYKSYKQDLKNLTMSQISDTTKSRIFKDYVEDMQFDTTDDENDLEIEHNLLHDAINGLSEIEKDFVNSKYLQCDKVSILRDKYPNLNVIQFARAVKNKLRTAILKMKRKNNM
jgi:hypothetical protein